MFIEELEKVVSGEDLEFAQTPLASPKQFNIDLSERRNFQTAEQCKVDKQKKTKKRKKKKGNPTARNQASINPMSSTRLPFDTGINDSTEGSSSINAAKILSARPLKEQLNESFKHTDSSEYEGIADYKVVGYHPVHVG